MYKPNTTNEKLDLIIDSIQDIRDMRKDVITIVEWKNTVNEKLDKLEVQDNKQHDCLKSGDIASLQTSVEFLNKWKWYILGILGMIAASMFTFSINISKEYGINKSYIYLNKENIEKLDRRVDGLRKKVGE